MRGKKLPSLCWLTSILLFADVPRISASSSFYVGFQGGGDDASLKLQNTHEFPDHTVGLDPVYERRTTKNLQEVQGGVTIGGDCRWIESKFALGFQLRAEIGGSKLEKDFFYDAGEPLKVRAERSFILTPAATMAYLVNTSLRLFMTVGIGIGKFKVKIEEKNYPLLSCKSSIKCTFIPSFGVEYQFSPHLSGIGFISMEKYKNMQFSFDGPMPGTPNTLTQTVSAQYFSGRVGILYRFSFLKGSH